MGWAGSLRVRLCDFRIHFDLPMPAVVELKVRNASHPLRMRTGNSSDRQVLRQIFAYGDYEPVRLTNPETIIDLGANVGYSSSYFLSKYPSVKVMAIEPERDNFRMCCENLRPFGERATLVQGAVWSETRPLAVRVGTVGDGREWSTQVVLPSDSADAESIVAGYDINYLIELFGSPKVDLLKIDIEGSELALFSRNTEGWLPRIRNMCIELHSDECAKAFYSALSNYAYDESRSGDLTICRNLRLNGTVPD
jgi:FkbM family methyltransferase